MFFRNKYFVKKMLSAFLALMLTLSVAAVPVFANEETDTAIDAAGYVKSDSAGKAVIEDGCYSADVAIMKATGINSAKTSSMANDAISHTAKIKVESGKVTAVIEFKAMSIGNTEGRLGKLSYFENGFSVGENGSVTGIAKAAEVLSLVRNNDGTILSDSLGTDYPDKVALLLVSDSLKLDSANENTNIRLYNDSGTANGTYTYSPIQVFVPVMESISAGLGTQLAYIRIDWSSLTKYGSDPVAEARAEESTGQKKAAETEAAKKAAKEAAEKKAAEEAAAKAAGAKITSSKVSGVSADVASTSKVKVTWSSVSGAGAYVVSYRQGNSGTWKTLTTSSTTATISGVKSLAALQIKVKASATISGIKYTGQDSSVLYYLQNKGKLSKVTKAKKAFTAKWKKVSSVVGYQISYSLNKDFSGAKTVTVKGAKKTSKKVSKLKSKKTYYVRTRVYKTVSGKKYYGAWSAVKKVKTK